MEEKKIDYRFKILYAIGIIMVCCGHTNGGGISLLNKWIPNGGMHLPLFVFSSGYFYKCSSEEQLTRYILRKIKTLLVPLYLYTIIYGVIVQILKQKGFEIGGEFNLYNIIVAPITEGNQFHYNLGGWFIAPLFMVEVFNVLLRKTVHLFKKNIAEGFLFSVSLAFGLIGNQLSCQGYNLGWLLVLVRMLFFMPFYGFGIYYKNRLEQYDKKVPSRWFFTIVLMAELIIGYHYGRMLTYTPSWCNDFTEGPIMPIIIGVLCIALWFRVATILEPVLGRSKWINLIADNTYSIMMNQFIGFMVVKTIYALLNRANIAFYDFDWVKYKTDLWWYYVPRGFGNMLALYVISGILFSIVTQKVIDTIKENLARINLHRCKKDFKPLK